MVIMNLVVISQCKWVNFFTAKLCREEFKNSRHSGDFDRIYRGSAAQLMTLYHSNQQGLFDEPTGYDRINAAIYKIMRLSDLPNNKEMGVGPDGTVLTL